MKHGGAGLLKKYNLETSLRMAFPGLHSLSVILLEKEWSSSWFEKTKNPSGYWTSESNQIEFLHQLAKKYRVKNPSDWGNITTFKVIKEGGKSIISMYGSLRKALKSLFPSIFYSLDKLIVKIYLGKKSGSIK